MPEKADQPIKAAPITRAHIEAAEALGFVLVRDPDGKVWFYARRLYAELVAAGKLTGCSGLQ